MVGLHENYLSQNVWLDIVNNPFLDFITYEDIFVLEKEKFHTGRCACGIIYKGNFTGIEVDLDCIENTLSSAETPAGILPVHARQYMNFIAVNSKPAYLHICEGASQLSDGRKSETTGKLISYRGKRFYKGRKPTKLPFIFFLALLFIS